MGMPHLLVPAVVFTSSLFVRSWLHANKGGAHGATYLRLADHQRRCKP